MTFSIIQKSQLEGALRLDAEYYQPNVYIDFSKGVWTTIGENFNCQYGLSLAMNDDKIGYPMYKMDDIHNAFLLDDNIRFAKVSEKDYKIYKLNKNDVLFNRVNSEEFVGRTGIFKDSISSVFASYLIRLTPKNDSNISSNYLNIFLNSKYGKKQIKKFSRRAVNQANVNAEELKLFRIMQLNNKQQRIIQSLSDQSWDELHESKRLYHQAEELLLKELGLEEFQAEKKIFSVVNLSDCKKANRIDAEYFQPKFAQLIKKLKNHKNKNLSEIIDNIPARYNPYAEPEKMFKYVELSNIDATLGVIRDSTKVYGREAASRAKRILVEGDVILSSVEGSLDKVAIVDKKHTGSLASTGFFQLRSKKILPKALLVLAKSIILQYQLQQRCAGTILTAVPYNSIEDIIIPDLSKSIQQKIAELVHKSHEARQKSKELLEQAKSKVEEIIEKGGD